MASSVARPRTTSTSFMTGTGFMKCIPITFSGRLVCAPRSVIEIDDVFDARMALGFTCLSSSAKIFFFRSWFSVAASTTTSHSANEP